MKWTIIPAVLFSLAGASLAPAAAPSPPPSVLAWKQTDSSLALVSGDRVVWQFNYKKAEGKPYFHPISIAGSPTLTDLRPKDHPWHRALWFSWKFINGLNYWEESPKTGRTEGDTELVSVLATPQDDHSARFTLALSYHPPGKPSVLTENRLLCVSAPTPAGAWQIDWQSTFTAGDADVHLDRTPIIREPKGRSYGGYAGLSLRLVPALRNWQFVGAGRTRDRFQHALAMDVVQRPDPGGPIGNDPRSGSPPELAASYAVVPYHKNALFQPGNPL